MASVPGTIIGATMVPTDSTDTYAITDPKWGKGGLRTVATTVVRNAISTPRLEEGMLVYCQDTGFTYKLKAGYATPTVDANWEVVASASSVSGVWVATTGNDANPGTEASPFLTLQKAVDTIHPFLGSTDSICTITVADGIYANTNVVIPDNATGYLILLGDAATPSNVVFTGSGGDIGITASSPFLALDIDGVSFTSYLYALQLTDCTYYERSVTYGASVSGRDIYSPRGLKYVHTSGDTSALRTADVGSTFGIYIRNGSFFNYGTITCTNCNYGIFLVDCDDVVQHGTYTFTGRAAGSASGLYVWRAQNMGLGGNMTIDLGAILTNNICVYANDCKTWFNSTDTITPITVTLTNFAKAWYFIGGNVYEPNVVNTFNYGAATNRLVITQSNNIFSQSLLSSLASSPLGFVVESDSFAGNGSMAYGSDFRYFQDAAKTGYELGRVTGISANTPTTLVTPTNGYVTVVQTINMVNLAAESIEVTVYHDDNGSTANASTMIFQESLSIGETRVLRVPIYMHDTTGRLRVECDENDGCKFVAHGYERENTLGSIPKMLGQVNPSNTNPVAVFNPANGYKTQITGMYIVNRNAGSQTCNIYLSADSGATYDDSTVIYKDKEVVKGVTEVIDDPYWMNDSVDGFFGFDASVANDLTFTVYGIQMLGA